MIDVLSIMEEVIKESTIQEVRVYNSNSASTIKNRAIFVNNVLTNTEYPALFQINIRGTPNKDNDTLYIASELNKLIHNKSFNNIIVNNKCYKVETIMEEYNLDGVDDNKRSVISTFIKMTIYEIRKDR